MDEREVIIQLIQEAVSGCARNWAEVITDHLIANNIRIVNPKTGKPAANLNGKCGTCIHSEPLQVDCWIKCKYHPSTVKARTQKGCKHYDRRK